MAAGGYKEFVAGETLDQDEINDYLMQGMLVFAGTAARGSAIGTPVEGQFSFLKDSDTVEFYDGSAWTALESGLPAFEFLVVGGGAGGDNTGGGGGGAGGFWAGTAYLQAGTVTITVGAGGAAAVRGNPSRFAEIQGVGGGDGSQGAIAPVLAGQFGASGGGAGGSNTVGAATIGGESISPQGNDGGDGVRLAPSSIRGGGGGGASAAGADGVTSGNGGNGQSSSITGSSVTYAGGGGGGSETLTQGSGGTGGGGNGGKYVSSGVDTPSAQNGTANTGGGGGGGYNTRGSGGSGIVILKYPDNITLTIGGGLTSSTSTSGGFKITSFTAGTDTVSF